MSVFSLAALLGLLSATPTPEVATFSHATTVGDVTATAQVWSARGDIVINTTFEGSRPVGCLGVYRDLRYELRDQDNRVIPEDPAVMANPPAGGQSDVVNHVISQRPGAPIPACSASKSLKKTRYALFQTLYRHRTLAPGSYTFSIWFAPKTSTLAGSLGSYKLTVDQDQGLHLIDLSN